MVRKLRILCLHGWRTSTTVISLQVAGFRQAFGQSGAEFVSLNAPFPATGPAQEAIRKFFGESGPYYQWWDAVKVPDFVPEKTTYVGLERTLEFVQRQIHELGPFDVVLGFSQGAALTTLLTAHYHAHAKEIPYKAAVLVCGLIPRDGLPNDLVLPFDIPSIHILGQQDEMLSLGHDLVETYSATSRKLYIHDEGHRFPALPKYKPMYVEMVEFLRHVCTDNQD